MQRQRRQQAEYSTERKNAQETVAANKVRQVKRFHLISCQMEKIRWEMVRREDDEEAFRPASADVGRTLMSDEIMRRRRSRQKGVRYE